MNYSTKIARGGLLTALTIIILYLTNIVPTSKLSLLTVASAIIPYAILTIGIKYSAIVYGAASILSLIFGLRGVALSYIVFFGLYGFIKYYIEGLNKVIIEIILKFVYFNICLLFIYNFYNVLFVNSNLDKLPIYLLIIAAELAFVFYDYVFTLIIHYIKRKFIKL